MNEALRKKIELFVASTNKIDGENSVIFGNAARQKVDVISTRSLKIDQALGVGGIPKGRITEVFGGESSAKTTLCLHTVAEAQSRGGAALYIDAENALDPGYAKNLGIDLNEITFAQPDTAEKSLTIAKNGLDCGAFDIVVIDSIASLVPRAVLEGDIGDAHVGVMARLMSQNLSKLANSAARTNTALVCINQTRTMIGQSYGDPTTTTGGKALRFYTSVRIQMNRSVLNKSGDEVLGNTVKVKVIKNKLAAPFKECEPEIIYGEGFSLEREILDFGDELGFVEKSGSWYKINGERVQGREEARQFLLANPGVTRELLLKIRESLGI
jgi:recombination protein RecA